MDRFRMDVTPNSHRNGKVALVAIVVLVAVAGTLAYLNWTSAPALVAGAQEVSQKSSTLQAESAGLDGFQRHGNRREEGRTNDHPTPDW